MLSVRGVMGVTQVAQNYVLTCRWVIQSAFVFSGQERRSERGTHSNVDYPVL